jgi:UDP:flavonoid glycosyltransferase YjiC (YdhE family)
MRVLITTPSAWGHLQPVVPLAKALQDRGHDVRWATGADSCGWLNKAGLQAIPAGVLQPALLGALASYRQEHPELPPESVPDFGYGRIFGAVAAPAMLRDLLPIVREWRPDLVINDNTEIAGPIIAAKLGVPNVTKAFGALFPAIRIRRAEEVVEPLWRSFGLEPRPYLGFYDHLYLDVFPPALQPDLPDHVRRRQLLRPVSYDASLDGTDEAAPEMPAGFPTIYLTMGTVFAQIEKLQAVVAAVAGLGENTLVTVGPRVDPDQLGAQPAHVRIERYVPQNLILDRCRVVVSHAGSGTALATMTRALPQLCLPQGADQFLNAWAIAKGGAGLYLHPSEAGPEAIAATVRRLLDEPLFAERAAVVADSIAGMPTPAEVVPVLEDLARS